MLGGPEPDNTASESTRSGQSALVSSHPDIQRGSARKVSVSLHFKIVPFLFLKRSVCVTIYSHARTCTE